MNKEIKKKKRKPCICLKLFHLQFNLRKGKIVIIVKGGKEKAMH